VALAAALVILPVRASAAPAPRVAEVPRPSAGSGMLGAPVWTPLLPDDAPSPAPVPPPLAAPGLGDVIEGIDFLGDAALTQYYHIPPDPFGAVGPGHVVSVVNSSIRWQAKDGGGATSMRLGKNSLTAVGSFFETLGPVNGTFDPKVIYDQHAGRFVVVSLERQDTVDGDPVNSSRILIAVSDDSDPNGTWYFQDINSEVDISGAHWADYPGLGVDEEAVYIAANMFTYGSGFFGGVRLWILDKGLYAGGGAASSVSVNDPYKDVIWASQGTTQPAHVYGNPGGAIGTWLVLYDGLSGGAGEYLQVTRVDTPLTAPTFTVQQIFSGDIENASGSLPDAPQNGTTRLVEVNDRRALSAVWRDNALWTTAEILPGSGTDTGQVTAHWWKVDTTNPASLTIADQGSVGGEEIATGTFTFFPSIMVDKFGNMGIGFAASAPSIYPGAYYTGRLFSDAAGTTQAPAVLAAGLDYYYRAFGGSRNRWGDYSGIALDPLNGTTFWIFNEYAVTRGTKLTGLPLEDGRWGTRWGSFFVNPTPVGIVSFRGTSLPGRIRVAWRTGSEIDTAGFHLWRAATPGGEPVRLTEAPIPAQGGVAVGASYAFVDSDVAVGASYTYELEDVALDGTSTFHGPVPAVAGRLVPVDPRRRALAAATVPPRFRWRSDPFDTFEIMLCAPPGCAPASRLLLPGPAGNRVRRGTRTWSYRPTAAEWRRARRLAGEGGVLSWRVLGEDAEGRHGRSAPRLLRLR